ncbi:hypothetical protein [Salinimicrobium soli]|uniref:hypothetical protein n=1 Tax=Salinimicrobium soli TaxID=1254399 RepID=UPI003AAD54EE
MKEFIHILIMSAFFAIAAHSQSQYDSGMEKAFELWQQGESTQAANMFERIAHAENEKWLPYYYSAQIKIVESFDMTDVAQKEQQLQEAQKLLDQARSIAGNENVELMVLQAMLHTSYITLDPATYGMKLSPVITNLYATAAKQAPENPRVALSRAEWNMGSARFFGEDPAKHCPELKEALLLFEEQETSEAFAPSWGKGRTEMLIDQMCGEKNDD